MMMPQAFTGNDGTLLEGLGASCLRVSNFESTASGTVTPKAELPEAARAARELYY